MSPVTANWIEVRAPGRVNLIGEHTDYNDGFVLPVAIDREIRIRLEPTEAPLIDLTLETTGERALIDLQPIGPRRGQWFDYVAGVALQLTAAGLPVGGFRGRLSSNLPIAAGLSSSAALELASAWALLAAGGALEESIDRLSLARLCQQADHAYVGINSGLMDQFASSCGRANNALLLDCRSAEYRPVPIPEGVCILVVDTGTRRRLVESEYNSRRAECERGVAVLNARGDQVASLRDATLPMLDTARDELGDITYRRCRHVVEENERTLAAVVALGRDDLESLGTLFAESHASLRDLYEVSSEELDVAVSIAWSTPGVIAARMTGAGFGGCTVNLVELDAIDRVKATIRRDYHARTGLNAEIHVVHAVDGAGIVQAQL